jgi:hypothetical protein
LSVVGEAVRLGRPLINKNTLLELRGATVPTQAALMGMLVTYQMLLDDPYHCQTEARREPKYVAMS